MDVKDRYREAASHALAGFQLIDEGLKTCIEQYHSKVRSARQTGLRAGTFAGASSGVAEPDCVFTTLAEPIDAVWYITRHEPVAGFVGTLKITPKVTACRLTIQLLPADGGSEADVTYSHTSLGPDGDAFVASFAEDHYRKFMQDWESRIKHYLRHGTALRATGG